MAITPGDGRDLRPWLEVIEVEAVLLREPGRVVAELAALVRSRGIAVHVHERCHDRPVADFLHRSSPSTWRGTGPSGAFGVSCHDAAELDAAFAAGASYALLSPVFSPTSKPGDTRPTLGRSGFERLAGSRPVYALGGITEATAFPAFGLALSGWFFGVSPAEALLRSRALGGGP